MRSADDFNNSEYVGECQQDVLDNDNLHARDVGWCLSNERFCRQVIFLTVRDIGPQLFTHPLRQDPVPGPDLIVPDNQYYLEGT